MYQELVQQLIMERFDKASSAVPPPSDPQPSPQTNGHSSPKPVKREAKVKSETPRTTATPSDADSDSDVAAPPKKKRKQAKGTKAMNDAQLAAMLQAQENSRTRATRGGGTKK